MYLRLNTKFNPFTYDELVRPLADYGKAYKEVEDAYSTLSEQAEAFKSEVNQHRNSEAYKTHSRYSEDLNTIIDDFSQGMTGANRAKLLGMKKRYNTEIAPIAKAAERRSALAEEQRKAEAANPTMMWERKASDMSLDEFINNPNAGYGRSYSGAALTAQVSANAAALAKEFRNNPDKMREVVGGDFYEYVKQRGFSSEAVLAAIANNPDASPVLLGLVENAINSSGVKDWATPETLKKAYSLAREGLWSAVGQEETQLVQNWKRQQQLSQSFQAAEAEKNREFQREMAEEAKKPRRLLKPDGTESDLWYDDKLGVVTDSKGNIRVDDNGNILYKPIPRAPKPTDKFDTNGRPTEMALRGVSDVKGMEDLGYAPIFTTQYHSGRWYSRQGGEDVPSVWNDFFTRTSLINDSGDVTYTPPKDRPATMSIVTDLNSIPKEALRSIKEEATRRGIPKDEPFYVMRVSGQGSRKNDYDYIVFRDKLK